MEYGELASDTLSKSNQDDSEQLYAPVSNDKSNLSASKAELRRAKEFLSIISPKSNLSLYDHLTALLKKIIRERIENAVDIFEDLSQRVKSIRYIEASTLVEILPPDEKLLNFIEHFKTLIQAVSVDENEAKPKVEVKSSDEDEDSSEKAEDEEDENEEEVDAFNLTDALPDIHLHMSRLSLAGIGLSTEEVYHLMLAFKVLVREYKLEKVRFWGKLFSIHCNFYVVEAMYKENIIPEDFGLKPEKPPDPVEETDKLKETPTTDEDEADEEEEEDKDDEEDKDEDEENENKVPEVPEENVIPPLPVLKPRAKAVPPEENGTGVNEYVYFVCSKIGEPWRCLPSLRPSHIVEAKEIKQYFRGNLAGDIRSCIFFSGKEAHYLRAQIARITASTCICLKDYYTIGKKKSESDEDGSDEDEDEENEDDGGDAVNKNADFQPPSVLSVFSAGLEAWVHCRPAILDQGRCTWMGMVEEKEEQLDEEVDEEASGSGEDSEKSGEEEKKEEKEESDIETPKETAVPPLRSLSEDKALGGFCPWSIKMSSKLINEASVLIVRSNIWPGAYTYYDGKTFETIYIGYGHKFSIYHYAPPIHSVWQKEYPIGPEITERIDYPIPVEEPPDEDDKGEEGDEEDESGSGSVSAED